MPDMKQMGGVNKAICFALPNPLRGDKPTPEGHPESHEEVQQQEADSPGDLESGCNFPGQLLDQFPIAANPMHESMMSYNLHLGFKVQGVGFRVPYTLSPKP